MANIGGASNENDSQIKCRRRFPLELQCEYGRRLLLLCHPIATNCVVLVRNQKERLKNGWDPTACHEYLTIIEPGRSVVQHFPSCCSVYAKRPIPKNGIFYYEVNIVVGKLSYDAIGLATKAVPFAQFSRPANSKGGTIAFWGNGIYAIYWSHPAEGGMPSNGRRPSLGAGDVIGCGVNLATRQMFHTKNGERLDTANLFVSDSADDLFPCVMILNLGDKIEANFGPNFKFNIAKVINRFYGVL